MVLKVIHRFPIIIIDITQETGKLMSIFSGTIHLKHDVFGIKIICYDAHCGNLMIIPWKLTISKIKNKFGRSK